MNKAFLLLIILFNINYAQSDVGAVSTATGGTGRGAVEPVDGLLLNPATLLDFPTQNFAFNYGSDEWALTVADNGKDAYFPAAVQFINRKTSLLDTQKLGFSFGLPRWKKVGFGGTLSMVEYGYHPAGNLDLKYRQGVFDFGMTWALTKNMGFGLVANRLASTRTDLAAGLQVQKTVGMGLSYVYQNFARVRFDIESAPENKVDKLVYMIGFENYINDWVVMRLGFQDNNVLVKDFFSAGVGFSGPQFGLHYAYITDVSNNNDQKHLFDLSVPF